MKNILLLTFAAAVLAGPVQANDKKLEALLDKAFTKEQTRIFKGRDKNSDGKMDRGEFTSLYGEGGAEGEGLPPTLCSLRICPGRRSTA